MNLTHRSVLITGASSGIGRATAMALAQRGTDVFLVARRENLLRDLAKEMRQANVRVGVWPVDLTEDGAAEEAVRRCLEALGGLDVLINNAGRGAYLPTLDVTPAIARALFELNVVAPLRLMGAVIPHMRAARDGLIVNIGSNAVLKGQPNVGMYAATKAALETLSVAARGELAELGVRVIIVSPGRTVSEFARHAVRGDGPPLTSGGLSPDGDPPCAASVVAEKIVRAIEHEAPWTAAPLGAGTHRMDRASWDESWFDTNPPAA